MQEYYVSFSSASEVHSFVSIATKQLFPVRVERDELCTDAKSIMSLFTLGLNRPLRLVLPEGDTDSFLTAVEPYLTA